MVYWERFVKRYVWLYMGQGITRVNFTGVKIQKKLKYRGTFRVIHCTLGSDVIS